MIKPNLISNAAEFSPLNAAVNDPLMMMASSSSSSSSPNHTTMSMSAIIKQESQSQSIKSSSSNSSSSKRLKNGGAKLSGIVSERVSDYRKNTKPLMEKRRRERINRSLEELKNLILDQTNHNVSIFCCLEATKKMFCFYSRVIFYLPFLLLFIC